MKKKIYSRVEIKVLEMINLNLVCASESVEIEDGGINDVSETWRTGEWM